MNLNRISFILLIVLFFLFPILFVPFLTDPFVLPKQALVIFVGLLILVFAAFQLLSGRQIVIRRTPFDLPLLFLAFAFILSTLFSVSKFDSIVTTIPFLSLILLYHIIVNVAKTRGRIMVLLVAFIISSSLASVVLILSWAKIHPAIPQTFSPIAALFASTLFLLFLLPPTLGVVGSKLSQKFSLKTLALALPSVFIIIAGFLGVYQLATSQKPTLLPYSFGLKIATSTIGQDFGNLLFGSGPGTFFIDFAKFRGPEFNSTPFWNTPFFSSSSFIFDLLSGVGVLGVVAFALLVISILRSLNTRSRIGLGLVLGILMIILVSLFLPIGYLSLFILVALLAFWANLQDEKSVFDTSLNIPKSALSFFLVALAGLFVVVLGYFGGRFLIGDYLFSRSLVAGSQGKIQETYEFQRQALINSPYRDSFRRIFAQNNLNIALGVSANLRQQNASPSAREQQQILALAKAAIDNGKAARDISPQNSLNWENMGLIYRSLIGFGRDAESFALATLRQAISLNPTHPQLYLTYGGIFYQLGQWDEAQKNFEIAVSLKPDHANAYYNLGHALESKNDIAGALIQYQAAEALLAKNAPESQDHKKIKAEIEALKGKAPGATQAAGEELKISTPPATLPEQKPPVEIP